MFNDILVVCSSAMGMAVHHCILQLFPLASQVAVLASDTMMLLIAGSVAQRFSKCLAEAGQSAMQQRLLNTGLRKQPSRTATSPGQQQQQAATGPQQESGQAGIHGIWVDHPAGVREAYSAVPGLEDSGKYFQDGAHAMGRVFDLAKDTAPYKGEHQAATSTRSGSGNCWCAMLALHWLSLAYGDDTAFVHLFRM